MEIIKNEQKLYQDHGHFNSFNVSIAALKEAINSVDPQFLIKKAIEIKNNKKN